MSFARFVWLLQTKTLWLSRADLLGDPWEIGLAGDQLDHVISRHPFIPLPLPLVRINWGLASRVIHTLPVLGI